MTEAGSLMLGGMRVHRIQAKRERVGAHQGDRVGQVDLHQCGCVTVRMLRYRAHINPPTDPSVPQIHRLMQTYMRS